MKISLFTSISDGMKKNPEMGKVTNLEVKKSEREKGERMRFCS